MRYLIKISYDGSKYCGFQIQNNKETIQECLESVLSKVVGERVSIVASGRTDAGVSAIEQVCHFDTQKELVEDRVKGYANSQLPSDIRIISVERVDENFHARYSAKRKTYNYCFYISESTIPVYEKFATNIGYNVNIQAMRDACKEFLGEKDFSAFCSSNTEVKNKVRTIYEIGITKLDDCLYVLSITGNGFLYNMVRIIMGTLVEVGLGKIDICQIKDIIHSCDRTKAGKTISAKGLFLKKVIY
ncbi:MAG: tRNA pseudouridine(38-40) synthase TruA [Clostridia bacterium]|nr:tRNA pseudouridine(38-40) synthase TruA [Clostridia bacterium]